MTAEREPDTIETIADVISQLEYHRQTHIGWAEHLERNPGVDSRFIGDAAFHRAAEDTYTQMIEVLRRALTGYGGNKHD